MTRQLLILRIISGFFLVTGLFTATFFLHAGGESPLAIGGAAVYLAAMLAISFGLLGRRPWSRHAAIIALLYKTAQFLVIAIRDARAMGAHSLDTWSRLIPLLTMVPILVLYLSAIRWLCNASTRDLFRSNKG
jgi:hypothetical protein